MRKPDDFENHPATYEYARSNGYFRAVCKHVVDGDTFDAFIDLGLGEYSYRTIRLHDLDTPEIFSGPPAEREHGHEAKLVVAQLILDRAILLKTYKEAETFGRYVADVKYFKLVEGGQIKELDLATMLRAEGFEKKESYP